MPTVKETFILSLTYEMSVDTETGEVLETKLIDRSVNKPVKAMKVTANEAGQDDDKEPKLYLEDNKCRLNSKAISLMGISPGDKLDIKYDDGKNGSVPIIGTDEAFGTKGGKIYWYFHSNKNSKIYLDRKYLKYLEFCRLYEESYKELQTKIGKDCDVNPEVIIETKESVTP